MENKAYDLKYKDNKHIELCSSFYHYNDVELLDLCYNILNYAPQ